MLTVFSWSNYESFSAILALVLLLVAKILLILNKQCIPTVFPSFFIHSINGWYKD